MREEVLEAVYEVTTGGHSRSAVNTPALVPLRHHRAGLVLVTISPVHVSPKTFRHMHSAVCVLFSAHRCWLSGALSAQTGGTAKRDSTRFDPIVVTATRVPTKLSSITVTVLQGDDLRNRGVTTLVRRASRNPRRPRWHRAARTGRRRRSSSRGGEAATRGPRRWRRRESGSLFENFSLENVDSIEVVRGPASALYGADAVSGVVQIFTKKGVPGAVHLDASGRAGRSGRGRAT